MRNIVVLVMVLSSLASSAQNGFYDFTVKTLENEDFALSQLKGKKVMVVNTASKCGLTPQYEQLEAIYKKYGGKDFTIIAFPANNFFRQEPGTAKEIRAFCTSKYGVTFPIMAKISVKGKNIAPLYQWLTQKSKNGVQDSKVKWNFQKYLIGKDGKLEKVIYPRTKPDDAEIIEWITAK